MEQEKRDPKLSPRKVIKTDKDGNKIYPKGTLLTKMKFYQSKKSEKIVGFVTSDSEDRLRGVPEDSPLRKKVCVVDSSIVDSVQPRVLYNVALIPMQTKPGYIVIEATPYKFHASIETTYVPKGCYVVSVRFGHCVVRYDPKDGQKRTCHSIEGVKEYLRSRNDILHIEDVIREFEEAAINLRNQYEKDGFIVRGA